MSTSSFLILIVVLSLTCVASHPHHEHVPHALHHAKAYVDDYHPVAIAPYNAADPVTYYSWHVHVYFLATNTIETASATNLRNSFIQQYNVTACSNECGTLCPVLCHWDLNMVPMGPHPIGSFGFYIPLENLLTTQTYFNQHAEASGLRILFHPNSGYAVVDHRDRGIWMKQILPLDLSQL